MHLHQSMSPLPIHPSSHVVANVQGSGNYISNCPYHWHWVLGLPDVPTHVYAHGSLLDRIISELKRVQFCLKLRSSSYNQWHWAALHDFSEIFAVVCLDKMGPDLRGDSASQRKIARITLLQLLPDRGNGENWNSMFLSFIHQLAKVRQGLMLVRRPDKYR